MLYMDKAEVAARLALAASNEYNDLIQFKRSPDWKDLTDAQRRGMVSHVRRIWEGATPEQGHESFLETRKAEGWVYGEEKDEVKKTSPLMVPYDKLPVDHRIKNRLFHAIAMTFKPDGD